MGLSSNILWHQTNKAGFDAILKSQKLLFSYSKETMLSGKTIAIPMVSLCDLPFADLGEYLGKYGNFTIGFDRKWGMKQGFNPVWYCEKESTIAKQLAQHDSEADKNLFSYIKLVEGRLETHGITYKNYKFYDEHEVRLVPSEEQMKEEGLRLLSVEEYDTFKSENGSSRTKLSVDFSLKNIKYLIVRDIRNVKQVQKDYPEIPVFTQYQVKQDFIGTNHSYGVRTKDTEFDLAEEFGQSISIAGKEGPVMGVFPKGQVIK